jgi:hypothetical protein
VGSGQRAYVDCSSAKDGNGSSSQPWNSLAEVNRVTLNAGVHGLLRRGTNGS